MDANEGSTPSEGISMGKLTDEYHIFLENLSVAGSTQESFRSALRMSFRMSWTESTRVVRQFLAKRLPRKNNFYE